MKTMLVLVLLGTAFLGGAVYFAMALFGSDEPTEILVMTKSDIAKEADRIGDIGDDRVTEIIARDADVSYAEDWYLLPMAESVTFVDGEMGPELMAEVAKKLESTSLLLNATHIEEDAFDVLDGVYLEGLEVRDFSLTPRHLAGIAKLASVQELVFRTQSAELRAGFAALAGLNRVGSIVIHLDVFLAESWLRKVASELRQAGCEFREIRFNGLGDQGYVVFGKDLEREAKTIRGSAGIRAPKENVDATKTMTKSERIADWKRREAAGEDPAKKYRAKYGPVPSVKTKTQE